MASAMTTAKHPGIVYYKSHASNANSGYCMYSIGDALVLGAGYKTTYVFKTPALQTGITRRMGFLDTTSVTAPTDGAYVKILDGVMTGQTAKDGTISTTASNITILANTWYRLVISVSDDGATVTYTLYADDSTNVLWTDTLTANIPTGALGHGDICTLETPAAATILGYIDYIDVTFPDARKVVQYSSSAASPSADFSAYKWYGKTSGWLGDSITDEDNLTDPLTVYWNVVKNKLLLTSAVSEAWTGAAISKEASYTDKRFTKRYTSLASGLEIIGVLGGVNDYVQNAVFGTMADEATDADNTSFYGSLKFLIEGLITRYPSGRLFFMTPLPYWSETKAYGATNTVDKTLKDYVDAIKEVCRWYSIPVCDLYAMSELYPYSSAQRTAFIPDGCHPNAAGHARIAEKIASFMQTL